MNNKLFSQLLKQKIKELNYDDLIKELPEKLELREFDGETESEGLIIYILDLLNHSFLYIEKVKEFIGFTNSESNLDKLEELVGELAPYNFGVLQDIKMSYFELGVLFYNFSSCFLKNEIPTEYILNSNINGIKTIKVNDPIIKWAEEFVDMEKVLYKRLVESRYKDIASINRISITISEIVDSCVQLNKLAMFFPKQCEKDPYAIIRFLYDSMLIYSDILSQTLKLEIDWKKFNLHISGLVN